ncbi:MAG: hypothetical protein M1834_008821 [Cirrosporium novae-zelandiae]|nr:MAG: hypothetical protein M1834_008821 [Cirrosporium novae-zelandiae]
MKQTARKLLVSAPRPIPKRIVKFSPRILINSSRNATQSFITTSDAFSKSSHSKIFGIGIVTIVLASAVLYYVPDADAEPCPEIRLSEVKEHGRDAERKWVIKGIRVYDITDWISGHPGGDVILRAAGGVIDQYWNIFSIHQKQEVYDILEEYYIGDVDPRDLVNGQVPVEGIDDPFKADPKRDPRLKQHTARPCNSETPSQELQSFLTPNETHFVRNHLWVPGAGESAHNLRIELHDGTEKVYTLEDLKTKFKPATVTVTLQCAGNRRKHMNEEAKPAMGLPWSVGAISTAEWTGVRLRDILADVGFPINDIPDHVRHAQFTGTEAYGASVPIDKAVDKRGDVILAYEMNGHPIPADHGYPLRAIVPGHTATRSVKWVNKVVLAEEESSSTWQQKDYKVFGPNESAHQLKWEGASAIQELPVQSAITKISEYFPVKAKDTASPQSVMVEGYAFSGGGRDIVRVDVSADSGKTWYQAQLLPNPAHGYKSWAWKQWRWIVPPEIEGRCFVVKAVDEAYNTQPGEYMAIWNVRGLLTNAWHRVNYGSKEE